MYISGFKTNAVIRRNNNSPFFLASLIFLETLRSFYFYDFGISLDNVAIFFLLILWFSSGFHLKRYHLIIFSWLGVAVAWGALMSSAGSTRWDTIAAIGIYGVLSAPMSGVVINDDAKKIAARAIKFVIAAHCTFFLLQLISGFFGMEP